MSLDRSFVIRAFPLLAFASLFALRLHQAEPGLLYPDGYQYLLMAKGIAAHGRPVLTLGPGGDTLLPNVDAAAKPLYPALVALVHGLGFGWLAAARVVNALAGAAVVILTGQLARRLTASWAAALVAAAVCVASAELAFWSGFAGPDALGQALALASALALLGRRPRLGGGLAALAMLARPELVLVALAAATVGIARFELRAATSRALIAGTLTLAAVLAAVRPPLGHPPAPAFAGALIAAVVAGVVFILATRGTGRIGVVLLAGTLVAGIAVAALAGRAPGVLHWMNRDWPLLLAGLGGCAFAIRTRRFHAIVCAVLLAGGLLMLVYAVKNPGSDRYLSLLTPLVAVLAGLGVAVPVRVQQRFAVVAVAGLICTTIALGSPPARTSDAFAGVARQLQALTLPAAPIVTAAPDAYGVLLPGRRVLVARPGVTGLIILDGAMRAYDPGLRFSARTLVTLDSGMGFVDPHGVIDRRPVQVAIGRVVGAERRLSDSGP